MSTPRPPVKTKLGIDELRKRTHRLSQRHRTTLFFVDGRRPLSEVLALTQRAGARTTHFADLVRLGMVDVGLGAQVPAAVSDEADDSRQPITRAMALDVPARDAGTPVSDDSAMGLSAWPAQADAGAASRASALAELEELHRDVRSLLIDTLRIDAPLFAAITLVRVQRARTTRELINLVWEIERHLVTSRKCPNELATLLRARELLGMGNTHVSTDAPIGLDDSA